MLRRSVIRATIQDILNLALNLPDVNSENVVIFKGSGPTIDWREQIYSKTNMLKDDRFAFRGYCGGNVAFPKKLIDEIGGFDEDFNHWGGEDTNLALERKNKVTGSSLKKVH